MPARSRWLLLLFLCAGVCLNFAAAQVAKNSSSKQKNVLPAAKSIDLTKQPTLYAVAYAHLDTEWRWEYPQVIREYLSKTLRNNFALADRYPHYIFNFSGANRYRLMKEYYPADFANLLQRFAVALTRAMPHTDVRRVVVESVAFLFKDSILPPAYLLGRLSFPRTVADASAMEQVFAESELDWTMVRPPELTDKPYTGKYRVREGHLPLFGFKISRADVADFMLKAAENHASSREVVGICN